MLAGAAPANAAVVHFTEPQCQSRYDPCRSELRFDAGPGEANRTTVTEMAAPTGTALIRFSDPAAEVQAPARCRSEDPHTVSCEFVPAGVLSVVVASGDGPDRIDVSQARIRPLSFGVRVEAGAGDDEAIGGPGSDGLNGGPGRDILTGSGGDDFLTDGEADEPSAGSGDDVFDGGEGNDQVFYTGRLSPVHVDLSLASSGSSGERDLLQSIEAASGGSGADTLRAATAGSALSGGRGDDRILGGPGKDTLAGDFGADRIDGGDGNDRINGGHGPDVLLGGHGHDALGPDDGGARKDPAPDRLNCASGSDRAWEVSRNDLVSPACERVLLHDTFVTLRQYAPLRSLRAPLVSLGTTECTAPICRHVLRVRTAGAGTTLGRVSFGVRGRRALRLSRRGRQLLERKRALRVRIEYESKPHSYIGQGAYLTKLHAP